MGFDCTWTKTMPRKYKHTWTNLPCSRSLCWWWRSSSASWSLRRPVAEATGWKRASDHQVRLRAGSCHLGCWLSCAWTCGRDRRTADAWRSAWTGTGSPPNRTGELDPSVCAAADVRSAAAVWWQCSSWSRMDCEAEQRGASICDWTWLWRDACSRRRWSRASLPPWGWSPGAWGAGKRAAGGCCTHPRRRCCLARQIRAVPGLVSPDPSACWCVWCHTRFYFWSVSVCFSLFCGFR